MDEAVLVLTFWDFFPALKVWYLILLLDTIYCA